MSATTEHAFGPTLRQWRRSRGLSQLSLALAAETSARHVSFLETGRAQPSRAMVLRLAEALDVPLRERNGLLNAAGFAAMFSRTPLDADAMRHVQRALRFMLDQQEPYPALVIDRHWNLLRVNAACGRLMSLLGFEGRPTTRAPNLLRMMLRGDGLRPWIEDWQSIARNLIQRARREASHAGGDAELDALIAEVLAYPGVPQGLGEAPPGQAALPLLPVTFVRDAMRLSWFTTITTFGTPQDITMQELRIEMLFPADEATERFARTCAAAS